MRTAHPASLDDADIVRLACQGDEFAWEALVRAHQTPLFRFAYLLLGSPDEAEDVTQETFIRAYRSLGRFDTSRPLRPWLFKIAANLAHNQRRSMGRYLAALTRLFIAERTAMRVPTGGALTARAPIEFQGDKHQEGEELWRAVQVLSEADQQIIYLRYFLDLSVDETAEAMGVAQGTVKSRLHRALERLRKVIEQDFPALRDWNDGRTNV
jgi:RNA polymerase sigma-70 factor (ECF subfamily)